MSLSKQAQKVLDEIGHALSTPMSEAESSRVARAVEAALIEAVVETSKRSAVAVNRCCSADQDLAHKLNEEIERDRQALIANLSGMR